jgi:serine protease Do
MKFSQRLGYQLMAAAAILVVTRPAVAEMTPASLKAVEAKVRAVVAKALPCTVAITSERTGAAGSGVIVSRDGLILTAGHVTRATGDELVVYFPNGEFVKATALGADYRKDSGMARIIDEGEYPFVELGESGSLEENQWCVALGHTAGFQARRTPPVRLGRILRDRVGGFISTDCALTGGDSGGPLFDLEGRLIGIHSNIGTSLMENRHIPIDTYRAQWEDMREGARLNDWNPPMLGVWLGEETQDGVQVEVMEGGPAEEAGVQTDDIILAVKGKPTPDGDSLLVEISKCRPGEPVEIEVLRGEERLKIDVTPVRRRPLMRRAGQGWQRGPRGRGGPQSQQEQQKDEEGENADSAEPDAADAAGPQRPSADAERDKPRESAEEEGSIDDNASPRSEAAQEGVKEQANERNGSRDNDSNAEDKAKPQAESPPSFERLGRRVREFLGMASPVEDKFFTDVVTGYRPINDTAADSVVKIIVDGKQVALGTVVREDGYVLTKASEIKDATPSIELADGQRIAASVKKKFDEFDLVLLRVPEQLVAAEFSSAVDELPLGSFVSAVGVDPTPLAIGVLSVARRSLAAKDQPFLGVTLTWAEGGLTITSVREDTAAAAAGLKAGDIVRGLDGKAYSSVPLFIQSLGRKRPGDEITLSLERDGQQLEQVVTLRGRSKADMRRDPTQKRYPQGRKLSANNDGYPDAIQTDLPFRRNECGSPLVDLDGRIIGLNIACAGRTKSYAIPSATIRKLLDSVLTE